MRKALITSEVIRGFCFGEDLEDHITVFVHMRYSADERYLHVNDLISYTREPSERRPGKFEARDFRYAGRNIARQVGEGKALAEGGVK